MSKKDTTKADDTAKDLATEDLTEENVDTLSTEDTEDTTKADDTAKKLKNGNYIVELKNPTEIDGKLCMPGEHEVTAEQYGRIKIFIS